MNSDMNSSMHSRRLASGRGGDDNQGTPESEFSNFECYQNYTAPEVFVQGLAGIVNQGDVEIIVRAQKQMLQRFEKTNEMILNCNALSSGRLKTTTDDLKAYTKVINDMKKDLDYIFRKIRNIKVKVNAQYPNAAKVVEQKLKVHTLCEEAEESEEQTAKGEETSTELQRSSSVKKNRGAASTVDYVQMEQSPDKNGERETEGEPTQRKSFDESTDNESSDGTTDT